MPYQHSSHQTFLDAAAADNGANPTTGPALKRFPLALPAARSDAGLKRAGNAMANILAAKTATARVDGLRLVMVERDAALLVAETLNREINAVAAGLGVTVPTS